MPISMHNFHNLYLADLPYVIWTGGTVDSSVFYRIVITVYDDRSFSGMTLVFESSIADRVDGMGERAWSPATTAQIAEMLTTAYKDLLFDELAESEDGYR